MVLKSGRHESVREDGPDRSDGRTRVSPRGGVSSPGAFGYAPDSPARDASGTGGEHPAGSLGVLVGVGRESVKGRPSSAANSPSVEHRLNKNLFIAGTRGVGKTQLLREVTLSRRERIGGFYTEHILSGHIRKGFMIRTFDGQERMLAAKGLKSAHKLGKYGVDLNALENVGVPALKLALMSKDLIVIDEIGSMEMMSERFRMTLLECLVSAKPVLATIRAASQPFSDQAKALADTQTILLTKSNYAAVKQQVRKWIDAQL